MCFSSYLQYPHHLSSLVMFFSTSEFFISIVYNFCASTHLSTISLLVLGYILDTSYHFSPSICLNVYSIVMDCYLKTNSISLPMKIFMDLI